MNSLVNKIIEEGFSNHIFTHVDLHNLLSGATSAARYGMINKAFKKKQLTKIRRGLYVLANKYRDNKISQLFLASRIIPHSYISLESALSYHGWIPEHVTGVSSILFRGRTKKFITPFGGFFYYQLPVNEYEFLTGVTRVEDIQDEPFLLASPLRALADYVYVKKIDDIGLHYLIESLRIEEDSIMQIDPNDFDEIEKVYRSKRVLLFLERLRREIHK